MLLSTRIDQTFLKIIVCLHENCLVAAFKEVPDQFIFLFVEFAYRLATNDMNCDSGCACDCPAKWTWLVIQQ